MKRRLIMPAAVSDLTAIRDFLAATAGAETARHVLLALRTEVRAVFRAPGLGHFRPDLTTKDVRFWTIYSYLIVYRDTAHTIEVLRVLHAARDVARILERRDA